MFWCIWLSWQRYPIARGDVSGIGGGDSDRGADGGGDRVSNAEHLVFEHRVKMEKRKQKIEQQYVIMLIHVF